MATPRDSRGVAESDGYSELGHSELLLAIHFGVPRGAAPLARASQFEVVDELLIIDNNVDAIDFVTELGEGVFAAAAQRLA